MLSANFFQKLEHQPSKKDGSKKRFCEPRINYGQNVFREDNSVDMVILTDKLIIIL